MTDAQKRRLAGWAIIGFVAWIFMFALVYGDSNDAGFAAIIATVAIIVVTLLMVGTSLIES